VKSEIPEVAALANRRVERIKEFVGIDVLQPTPYKRMNKLKHHGNWKDFIVQSVDDSDDMEALGCYLQEFVRREHWDVYTDFTCITDYVLKCLKVGDIHPSECTRDQPVYNMRHLLSYITDPWDHKPSITPAKRFKATGESQR
jgi:hypothetical protein